MVSRTAFRKATPMMWFPMFRNVLSSLRSARGRARSPRPGVRLQLERLEDRTVPSTLSINNVTLPDGSQCAMPGVPRTPTPFTFTVTLSAASAQTATVAYATQDGTAIGGATIGGPYGDPDYQIVSGTLTFAPGETSKTITVNVNPEAYKEKTETFYVNLSNATNATIGTAQGKGKILNDDAAKTACGSTTGMTASPMPGSPSYLDHASLDAFFADVGAKKHDVLSAM
jgi:hypothetical protein